MSIAVSTVIAPSRLLHVLMLGAACAHAAAALLLLGRADGAVGGPLVALACLLCAGQCAAHALARPNARRIDISGLGAIRLTVQGYRGPATVPDGPLALLPGSTLWPQLLLLRLKGPESRTTVLAVLADSVDGLSFRPLAVSLRHIAQSNKYFIQIKETD